MRKLKFSRSLLISILVLSLTAAVALASSLSGGSATRSGAVPDPAFDPQATATGSQKAVFAGGCFWGMEGVFEHLKGVSDVKTGYAGDDAATATYEQVSAGGTRHAEAVEVTYDPTKISYGELLKIYFFVAHDPTELNRQGPDVGEQYRSEIFFANEQQQQVAAAYIQQLDEAKAFDQPIVTQMAPLNRFYNAEAYHQDFIKRNPLKPYVVIHDLPQIRQLEAEFPDMYQ